MKMPILSMFIQKAEVKTKSRIGSNKVEIKLIVPRNQPLDKLLHTVKDRKAILEHQADVSRWLKSIAFKRFNQT